MESASSTQAALLPKLLFVVISSISTHRRAFWAANSWCKAHGVSCLFYADRPLSTQVGHGLKWTAIATNTPKNCCKRGSRGFFCSAHRRQTLQAQYRYLPALHHARRSHVFNKDGAQWIVLLDDDSVVFVRQLQLLLSKYTAHQAVVLGEFKHDLSYACGGAGLVLSREALIRLNLDTCISRTKHRCMQSDWMVGECIRKYSHAIRIVSEHGCGSCAVRNCTADCAVKLANGCQFMQNAAQHMDWLLRRANSTLVSSPSIVHGGTMSVIGKSTRA